MTLETRLITESSELEALAADWDRLWSSDPNRSIFGTLAWSRASWRAYGAARKLCTIVVTAGSKTLGILPLAAEGSTLMFLGAPRSDYNDILCEEHNAAAVTEAALLALQRVRD
ncbi:MAG: hypothetical protein KF861_23405, partial [Planctomycetaceae bacterium]|nr:hypothetical protein [Planctomycetaceae bacterium]